MHIYSSWYMYTPCIHISYILSRFMLFAYQSSIIELFTLYILYYITTHVYDSRPII